METKSEWDKNMKALFEIKNVDVTSRQDTIVITFYLTLFFVSEVIILQIQSKTLHQHVNQLSACFS